MKNLNPLFFVVPHDHCPEMFHWTGWINWFGWFFVVTESNGLFVESPIFPSEDRGREDTDTILSWLNLEVISCSYWWFIIFW
jgi:hypothetical protein